jgi:hypothetical protein
MRLKISKIVSDSQAFDEKSSSSSCDDATEGSKFRNYKFIG